MGLREYKRKRNFSRTPEPAGKAGHKTAADALSFVIQKHAASRLHYDLRLEMEGVLKSWAVPKGFPTTRGDKRLAVHVEDHPLAYASFEGIIAEGNYGAGTVMVWDRGTYTSPVDPLRGLKAGKLHVTFNGSKLKGDWTLVRMGGKAASDEGKEQWLLLKSGSDVKPFNARVDDTSAVSKRSMKQIATARDAEWKSNRAAKSSPRTALKVGPRVSSRAKSPPDTTPMDQALDSCPRARAAFIAPMKARLVDQPPGGDGWRFEIKLDGYRAIAVKQGKQVHLYSRNHLPLGDKFSGLSEAVTELSPSAFVLDGEIIALDSEGRSSFQLLQNAGTTRAPVLRYYLFDVLNLENRDVRKLPLIERKKILQSIVGEAAGPVRFLEALEADPHQLLEKIRRKGFEGIIAKRADSTYEAGARSGAWLKIKCINEQEFVLGGYTEPKGSRSLFGAVLVGYYERGQLKFAAKVGTGFNEKSLRALHKQFQPLRQAECPFSNLPTPRRQRYGQGLTAAEMRKCTWLKPRLVCQVKFTEWTGDGSLRHPVFLGLREDKSASEVRREKPA